MWLSFPFNLEFTRISEKVRTCRSPRVAPGPRGSTTIPSGRETRSVRQLSVLSQDTALHLLEAVRGWKLILVIHSGSRPPEHTLLLRLDIAPQTQVRQSQETSRTHIALHFLKRNYSFKLEPSLIYIYLGKNAINPATFKKMSHRIQ